MLKERVVERIIVQKEPPIVLFYPEWWNGHGTKMLLRKDESSSDKVVIRGSVTEVIISKTKDKENECDVSWSINHCTPTKEQVKGSTRMETDTLKAAFGLDDTTPRDSEWLIQRYGATCAEQSRFIRYKNFLNIPGPGTGWDGDPNISIDLDKDIQQAIQSLLL